MQTDSSEIRFGIRRVQKVTWGQAEDWLPLVGTSWQTLHTRPWCQLKALEAQAIPIPPGPACILRTRNSRYWQNGLWSSPGHTPQGERSRTKLLVCSRQTSLPDSLQTPALTVKGTSPWYPRLGETNAQSRDLNLSGKVVALSNRCSATAYALQSAIKERCRAWTGLILLGFSCKQIFGRRDWAAVVNVNDLRAKPLPLT